MNERNELTPPDGTQKTRVETESMGELMLPPPRNAGAESVIKIIDRILAVAPAGVDRSQFAVACVTEINALSQQCSPVSVLTAAFNCATLGLIPGATLGYAYFVPFKGVCTLIPGYRGFLELALGNAFLRDVHTNVVLRDEQFRQWVSADGPQIEHEIPLDRSLERANVMAAYCVYHTVSGGHGITVVSKRELDKLAQRGNVWNSNFCPMSQKTTIRRSSKEWRLSRRFALAVHLDEQAERGERQSCDMPVDEPVTQPVSFGDYQTEGADVLSPVDERAAHGIEEAVT